MTLMIYEASVTDIISIMKIVSGRLKVVTLVDLTRWFPTSSLFSSLVLNLHDFNMNLDSQ